MGRPAHSLSLRRQIQIILLSNFVHGLLLTFIELRVIYSPKLIPVLILTRPYLRGFTLFLVNFILIPVLLKVQHEKIILMVLFPLKHLQGVIGVRVHGVLFDLVK